MWLLIGVCTALIILLRWILKNQYSYWKKQGVSGPRPTWFLGNLGPSLTQKQNLGQTYEKIYNDYKNVPYIGYYKFLTPGLIIRDIDLIKSVLIKDFASFHDNSFELDVKTDPLFGNNPFVLRGQRWKEVRNLVTSGITTSKVKAMFYLISNVCNNLVKYLDKQPYSKDGIEAKELACKFTTDAVASCAFGLEAGCLEDREEESEFTKMGRKFMSPDFWIGLKHTALFVLPTLAKYLKLKVVPDEVEQWFINIVKDTMKYRKENNINRNDYLDMLIGLQTKTNGAFSAIDIAAQALTFYGDGFETSSIAIAYTLYELGENKDIQEKLRKEMDSTLSKYNGEISYDAIQEMTYLDMVLNESLRKYSPAQFIARIATKTFEFPPPGGEGTGPNLVVKPGTPIIVPILGVHQDPEYYPNPQKFDPDRFKEENKAKRPKCTFLAFGEGPRICLGSKFGLSQTKAALVAIISNFEVSVNPKTKTPLKMDPSYLLTSHIGGLWLNFTKRKN